MMRKMQIVHFYWAFFCSTYYLQQVDAYSYVTLSHNGPVVLGGTITFRADLFDGDGERPSGNFKYKWDDNALIQHSYETEPTSNTTTYWSISYPREKYTVGIYNVEVVVSTKLPLTFWWTDITSRRITFYVTQFLNGNMTIIQSNHTLEDSYVSSATEANVTLSIRKGDYDYIINKASSISTFWFIDCKYYGQTNDFSFPYNFTTTDVEHVIEALVVASYDPPTTTTISPPTTVTVPITTTSVPNNTTTNANVTVTTTISSTPYNANTTTSKPTIISSTTPMSTKPALNATTVPVDTTNISLPYICMNSSIIPPDPNKTYGHFLKKINVRAPITDIKTVGTNWIQPWDMLSLNVSCKGSGPYYKCLQFHRGEYNVTGNETCDYTEHLQSCNFSIIHYFLEPSVYTILVILNNEVSKQIYPLQINIYKVTTKPQLSVVIIPVTCSLAAVVLIVFGVAYYIQSRSRFTVEVADFDFGQNNPEVEYKTFKERLRDSFENAVRPGNKRISVRPPYYGSMNH